MADAEGLLLLRLRVAYGILEGQGSFWFGTPLQARYRLMRRRALILKEKV